MEHSLSMSSNLPCIAPRDFLWNLDKGMGHFESSSMPIGGKNTRAVLSGHSGLENQVLFTDIKNLKEGDIFFVNILGKKLAYESDSFQEVLPVK